MKYDECENLDLAMTLWLTEEEQARFDAHLAHCDVCRQAMAHQRQIDQLLRRAVDHLEQAPPELLARIDRELEPVARTRPNKILRRAGWAVAATVVIAVSGWFLSDHFAGPTNLPPVAKNGATPQEDVRPTIKPQTKVIWHDPEEVILVPIESDVPNVTIVWVYPTIKMDEDDVVEEN